VTEESNDEGMPAEFELAPPPPADLRIAFVPGVTVRKWTRAWADRHPDLRLEVTPTAEFDATALVADGTVHVAFVRLPIESEGLSVVRLYGEVSVLAIPRDHPLASATELTLENLSEISPLAEYPVPGVLKDAVALVGAGVGGLRLPHSLARLHARKDVVAIPLSDAPVTDIAIVWLAETTTPRIEEFVGIVRGRTAASSRSVEAPVYGAKKVKKTAAAKAAAREVRESTGKGGKAGAGGAGKAGAGKSGAKPSKPKPHQITGNRAQATNRKRRSGGR
jgi:DNA-binding transcriptional LysR family regulator